MFTQNKPISLYWFIFTTPGSIRKPKVFFMFSPGIERGQWHEMGYSKLVIDQSVIQNLPIFFSVIKCISFGMRV